MNAATYSPVGSALAAQVTRQWGAGPTYQDLRTSLETTFDSITTSSETTDTEKALAQMGRAVGNADMKSDWAAAMENEVAKVIAARPQGTTLQVMTMAADNISHITGGGLTGAGQLRFGLEQALDCMAKVAE